MSALRGAIMSRSLINLSGMIMAMAMVPPPGAVQKSGSGVSATKKSIDSNRSSRKSPKTRKHTSS